MLDLLIGSLSEIKSYVVVLSFYIKMMKQRTFQAGSLRYSIKTSMFHVQGKLDFFLRACGDEWHPLPCHVTDSYSTDQKSNFFSCLTFFIKWASFWMFLVFKICPNLEIDHLRMLITPRWSFTSTSKHPQEKFTRVSRTIKHSVSKENIKFLVPLRSRNSRQRTSVNIFYLKHLINIVESSI